MGLGPRCAWTELPHAFRIEEGDAVVAVVTQHKRSYEELQRALRNANLEVCLLVSSILPTTTLCCHCI